MINYESAGLHGKIMIKIFIFIAITGTAIIVFPYLLGEKELIAYQEQMKKFLFRRCK